MRRLLGALVALAALPASSGELRVGRASVKITPPAGMPMAGYYNIRLNEGVHDDLFAKALVLELDGVKAALVGLDLIAAPWPMVEAVRAAVTGSTSIPGEHVMVSASHTHTGPDMAADPRGADDATRKIAGRYHAELPGRIAEAVRLANAGLQPARAWTGIGHENSVSFIRRFLMKDGSVGWNPGKLNPDIVRPLGGIDPSVHVLYFDSPTGEPLATYVNFALHLDTVGGMAFSADYPGTISQRLAAAKGESMITLFTNGACGNINHLDVKSKDPQKGHAEAARIGTVLAGSVLKTFRDLEQVDTTRLVVRRATAKLPVVPVTAEEVAQAEKVAETFGTPRAPAFYEQVKAFRILQARDQRGQPFDAEVQVVTLGTQVAWVGLPGEVFVELGKAIKIGSPFPNTVVAELSNDKVVDYIPDRRAYPEGAYEVISSPLMPGSGEALVETAINLLIEARGQFPPPYKR